MPHSNVILDFVLTQVQLPIRYSFHSSLMILACTFGLTVSFEEQEDPELYFQSIKDLQMLQADQNMTEPRNLSAVKFYMWTPGG